jgi:predicted nucleotidyltransferase
MLGPDPDHPGAPFIVREALAGLEGQITIAFVFGSVAQGTERADSDLDLFVIGTAGYSLVTERLYPVEERVGRPVQVLYFDPTSAQDRKSLHKSSMKVILAGPKLFVLGDDSRLTALLKSVQGAIAGKS